MVGDGEWRAMRSRLVQLGMTQQWRRVSAEIVAIVKQELGLVPRRGIRLAGARQSLRERWYCFAEDC